jgi:nitrous oxidase accessory protein NosD
MKRIMFIAFTLVLLAASFVSAKVHLGIVSAVDDRAAALQKQKLATPTPGKTAGPVQTPTLAPTATATPLVYAPPTPSSTLVINVKNPPYNAQGNGSTDDTASLQSAVNAGGGTGGTVLIPDGTYLINALTGVQLRNNMTLKLATLAVLKAIPNSSANYEILGVHEASQVNIIGGTLLGERYAHTGATGEWGMGINITNSQSVWVEGVVANNFWGDGFYVGSGSWQCTHVTFNQVSAQYNRRQGLSLTWADTVLVRNSTFSFSGGDPNAGAGIDIEPNPQQTVSNVRITGCMFAGNSACGVGSGVPGANTGVAFTYNVLIDGNTATANLNRGFDISNAGAHQVLDNIATGNYGSGIYIRENANSNLIRGNLVTGSVPKTGENGYGILLYNCQGNTVTANTATGNGGLGIRDAYPSGGGTNHVFNNTESGNGSF